MFFWNLKPGKADCPAHFRDGILGHKFHKRLESFTPCYSQSLDFTGPYSSLVLKFLTKKSRETRKLESSVFMNNILLKGKMRVEIRQKLKSEKTRVYAQ